MLQASRGGAAMLVVFSHTNTSFFGNPRYWPDIPFGNYPEFGHAGVELFFVLSGFIIYAAHRNDLGVRARFGGFVWKRFRRVYPVCWVALLMVLPLYLFVPSFASGVERQLGVLFDNIFLIHAFGTASSDQILVVSWTLFHEVMFYAIFAVAILNLPLGTVALGVWIAASAAALAVPAQIPPALVFTLSPLHVLFGMGIAAAWFINHHRVALPWIVAAAGAVLFFGTGAEEALYGHHISADESSMLYGLGSTLVVAAGVELERSGRLTVPRSLVFMGDASYSIYLVHFTAMSVVAKVALVIMAHLAVPHAVTYFVLAICSITAGVLFHMVVEVPLLARLSRMRPALRAVEPAPI